MKRKTFIKQVSFGSTAALLLPTMGVLQSCEYKPKLRSVLSEADIAMLDEIGETIIPSTSDLPGAKATEIGAYMLLMYQDCMELEDQEILVDGINTLDRLSASQFSTSFEKAEEAERLKLLKDAQLEATDYNLQYEGELEYPPHYFDILKGLTLTGYFTSEIGMTQAREYLPLPGKFIACMPYNQGDKVWAI